MNKGKRTANDFKQVILSNIAIVVLAFIINILIVDVMGILLYDTPFNTFDMDVAQVLNNDNTQFVFTGGNPNAIVWIMAFANIFPMFLAWNMFSFVNNKKKANVYFSMGVSRNRMFLNRFVVAFFMIAIVTIIPVVVLIGWNTATFGWSIQLMRAGIFLILRLFLTSLFAFSVSVIVTTLVASRIEEKVFTPVFLLIPSGVIYMFDALRNLMFYGAVPGSEKKLVLNDYREISSVGDGTLTSNLNRFNNLPVFNHSSLDKYTSSAKSDPKLLIDWLPLVVLLLATVLISLFAYRRFIKKRVERVGFFGISITANAVFVGALTVGIITVLCYFGLDKGFSSTYILLCIVAVSVISYFILMPILTHSKKLFARRIWTLPIFVLILASPALVLASGVGEGRIPDLERVKAASISLPIYTTRMTMETARFYTPLINLEGGPSFNLAGFTSEKDIIQIQKIHKKIIGGKDKETTEQSGYVKKMSIFYELKNGSIVQREYDYFDKDIAEEWLKIVDSDFLKNEYITTLENTTNFDTNEIIKLKKQYPAGNVVEKASFASDNLAGTKASIYNAKGLTSGIRLTEQETNYLRNAIARDLRIVPLSTIYFSEKQNLGTVYFTLDESQEYNSLKNDAKIPIVEEMKNTVAYLEKFGFTVNQGKADVPVSAVVIDLKSFLTGLEEPKEKYNLWYGYYLHSYREYLKSENQNESFMDMLNAIPDCKNNEVTDRGDLIKLQEVSRKNQFTYNEGYAIVYKYADNMICAEYIPENKMPDSLKP